MITLTKLISRRIGRMDPYQNGAHTAPMVTRCSSDSRPQLLQPSFQALSQKNGMILDRAMRTVRAQTGWIKVAAVIALTLSTRPSTAQIEAAL